LKTALAGNTTISSRNYGTPDSEECACLCQYPRIGFEKETAAGHNNFPLTHPGTAVIAKTNVGVHGS